MAGSSEPDVLEKLATLQLVFKQQLPNKMAEIERLWGELGENKLVDSNLSDIHRMAHGLAGSGGTFGAVEVSNLARKLEQSLKLLITESDQTTTTAKTSQHQIDDLIVQLRHITDEWQPSAIPYIKPGEPKMQDHSDFVFLAEDDELLAASLIVNLEEEGYQVRHFVELKDFEAACIKEKPVAIIMDIVFEEGELAGTEIITRLKDRIEVCPPVIFISVRDDIEVRLAATRAGAHRYFSKPLDISKLIQTLDGLTSRVSASPLRILLIDDDETLIEYYATVMSDAGMVVETLSDPIEGLKVLADFKPDIVVMDVYMPGCSGPELAQVIRQDDAYAIMPIMFLSTESNFENQLAAMNLGGDDFLVKPVEAGHLIAAVSARAKRAREASQLNTDLENALRENKYQIITMNQHDIVSSTDTNGQIINVNDLFCEITGYSRTELLGKNHNILKSGMQSDAFYENLWETIKQGKIWHGKICNRKKSGDEYWVESTIVPFLDEKGSPYKYVSATTEITSLRQSEDRLHRSQIFANIGTWDWNIVTGELYWSELIGPLFGYKENMLETTYENFLAAVHPDDRQAVIDAVNNCIDNKCEYNIEHRVVWPDSSVHWVLEQGNVVRSEDGEPLHMLGVVQDVDDRKRAELMLAKHERQLSEAQVLARLGNWQANLVNGVLTWSDEIYRIFGFEPGDIKPTVDIFKKMVHPDDLALVEESEKIAAQTGHLDVAHRIVWSDGTVRYVHELAQAEIDVTGNLTLLTGTVQDITDSKLAEQALLKAKEEAENANRTKSQFLSSMSHELRTPLNAIIGFGQLLQLETNHPLNESQLENVDEIVKAGNHLLELINEVLDLARIEAGRIDLSIKTVVVSKVLVESIQLITPLAKKRGIEIGLIFDDDEISLKELIDKNNTVRADYTRLKQTLLNLLSNAVKYNRENGKLIIACRCIDQHQTRISITDTGAGLTQKQQSQLFKAFNRLEAGNTEIEGTGIGLVITKNIVELMGGNIGVESQPGAGSTFWIELPIDTPYQAETIQADNDENISPEVVDSPKHEHTVLYIEDNPANLRLVAQLLGRRPNIHMWSAHEPRLGLELAQAHKPNLILLDINLPGMDGFEVLKNLRQSEEMRDTPVIAVSANAIPEDIKKGLDAGFDNYITKPINVKALLEVVDDVFQYDM